MSKSLKRILSVFFAALMVVANINTGMFTNVVPVLADTADTVRVIVENTTYSAESGAQWTGTLLDANVELKSDSTAISVVSDAVKAAGYDINDYGGTYISEINGLGEYYDSTTWEYRGYMGTINNWFTNQGLSNYTAANGELQAGDVVKIMYTCTMGSDIGSDWSNTSTKLKSLSFSAGTLDKDFSADTLEYTLTLPAGTKEITVTPIAENMNFQVRTYKNEFAPEVSGKEYRLTESIPVTNNDKLYIGVGYVNADDSSKSWPASVSGQTTTMYTINIVADDNGDSGNKSGNDDENNGDVNLTNIYEETMNAMLDNDVPTVSYVGGEWEIVALARAEQLSDSFKTGYLNNVADYVKALEGNKLSNTKSTENTRVILALTAIGADPSNVEGKNLLAPLADMDYVNNQGVNGSIWALIALDSAKYDIPAADASVTNVTTREKLIASILEFQCEDGGFSLDGKTSEVDITAMALTALSSYDTDEVKAAVDKAVAYLSSVQNDDGSYGLSGTANTESTAQVIIALTSLGINPKSDERFLKNGKNTITALNSFYLGNGQFAHQAGGDYNQISTEQAALALVAYERFGTNKTTLYDMTDAKLTVSLTDSQADSNTSTAATTDVSSSSPKTGDTAEDIIVLGLALMCCAIAVAVVSKKKTNN